MVQDHAVPEDGEQAVVPGDDSNNDPTPPLPAEQEDQRVPAPASQSATREEPEIGSEQDIPSDGADAVGERMIQNLGSASQAPAGSAV